MSEHLKKKIKWRNKIYAEYLNGKNEVLITLHCKM